MLKIEYVPIGDLKPYENNAKIHTDEQIEQIKKSIQEFGFNDPIAVWKDGEIIEGHGRLFAAQQLGLKEVPIIRLDNLTDEERRAYMLAHNKLTMNTGFDIDILNKEIENITEFEIKKYIEGRDKKRFVVIPDSEDGNIAKKRNWILKNISRPLIMIDDDVKRLTMCEGGEYFRQHGRAKQMIPLTPSEAVNIMIQAANLAHEWGCPIFGFNLNTDGRNYQQYKPFSLTQPILGPCSGHLDHDLLYD